jgi:glycosyltransferase involved in cell wall biosynthesis
MISIVIPLYNKEKQIADTLRSVFNQTFQDFEIVIVNDGSTDHSIEIVKRFDDKRIRIIEQENQGVSVARNTGIQAARYDYIAFLDADDEWDADYLDSIIHLIQQYPQAAIYATAYRAKDENNKLQNIRLNHLTFTDTGILDNYFQVSATSSPPLWTSAVSVRKKSLLDIGLFPEGIGSGEDLITWARLAVKNKIAYNTTPHATYSISIDSKKGTPPPDMKSTNDYVGISLEELYKKETHIKKKKEMALYISFWYKMRASINLDLNNRYAAIRCALKSLRYNPLNGKVYIFFFLTIMPSAIIVYIISKFRKI